MTSERCSHCGGWLRVSTSRIKGNLRVRYLACGNCGKSPPDNKRCVPLNDAPSRGSGSLSAAA